MSISIVSLRLLRQKLARSSTFKTAVRFGSDHHGPNMPPFAQLRPPTTMLPEEVELVWDDGVAPETCIDFDAPHIDIKDILFGFTAVIGSLVGLYSVISFMDPAGNSPVAPRSAVIPVNTVNLFFGIDSPDSDGGDADEEEEEEEDDE